MTEFSAKATFATAIREPVNWLNLLLPSLSVLLGVSWLMLGLMTQDGGQALLGLALTAISIAWGYLYLRYMRSISFELTAEAFRYQAEGRKLYFAWKDIEAVKVQPKVKRLTLWAQGKPRAMQYVGIADSELAQLQQFLQTMIAEYGIQQK